MKAQWIAPLAVLALITSFGAQASSPKSSNTTTPATTPSFATKASASTTAAPAVSAATAPSTSTIKSSAPLATTSTLKSAAPAATKALVGKMAPDFTLTGQDGATYKLSDFRGKYVVLEWTNHKCPFVKKHYSSNNLPELQEKYTDQGVAWFAINSSATGNEGYLDSVKDAAKIYKQLDMNATALLLDSEGSVGRTYGAKTTPQMFVVSPKGTIIYSGALDSDANLAKEGLATATNYVAQTLDAALSGQKITTASTKPYGCSVKYGH